MLKLVKQFFALSLCLLMLLPFASAAFVDPGNTVIPFSVKQCSCGDNANIIAVTTIRVNQRNSYYCQGSYITWLAYECGICSGYIQGDIVSDYHVSHEYPENGVRCNNCGWLISD